MNDPPVTPSWLRAFGLAALSFVLSVFAWWPMFAAYPKTPEEDGRYVYQQFEIAKASLRTYGELPLWNPFDCRGIPMWDHPESMTASPIVLLTANINTTITIILWNLIHLMVGFIGMWLLVRKELRLSRAAAFVGASSFAFSVGILSQVAGEHETLITFLFAPLLILLWRKAEHRIDCAVGLGIVLALMLYNGATYPLPYSGLMLAIETLTRLRSPERALRIAKVGLVAVGTAVLLGAARLLPLYAQLTSHTRAMYPDTDSLKSDSLWLMYTLRSPHWRSHFNGQQYVFGEYISYIGWMGVALAVAGAVIAIFEEGWLFVLAAALLALTAGHFAKWAPWHVLQGHVFPFKSMRVPARFRLLEMMCLSGFMALAVDRIPVRLRRFGLGRGASDALRVALLGTALLAAGDAIGLGQDILGYRFNGAPPQNVARSVRFHYGGPGLAHDIIDHPRQNRAWLGCRSYEWAFRADAPLWEGDVPQAKTLDADAVVVEVANRTHNTFTIDVDVKRPGRIILDSAYDPSWRTSLGKVVEDRKLLAIDLETPGRHRIHVKYWPRYLTLGFVLTGIGILGVVAFFFRGRIAMVRARIREKKP